MEDFDLRTATYDMYELDEHGPIQIAGLHLDNNSDNAGNETASDDWESPSDEDSDGQDN